MARKLQDKKKVPAKKAVRAKKAPAKKASPKKSKWPEKKTIHQAKELPKIREQVNSPENVGVVDYAKMHFNEYTTKDLEMELTPAEVFFAKRLVIRMGNQTQAYQDVFPYVKSSTASQQASLFTKRPKVFLLYRKYLLEAVASEKIDEDFLITKHKEVIDAEITEFYQPKKKGLVLKSIKDFPEKYRWLVQEIHETRDGVRIKLMDKHRSLDALADFAGLKKSTEKSNQVVVNFSEEMEGL